MLTICVIVFEYGDTFALTGRQQGLNAYPGRCPGLCKTLGFQPAQSLYPYKSLLSLKMLFNNFVLYPYIKEGGSKNSDGRFALSWETSFCR